MSVITMVLGTHHGPENLTVAHIASSAPALWLWLWSANERLKVERLYIIAGL